MKNKKHVRNFSLLLCAALLAGQMGMTVYAEETSSGNRGGGGQKDAENCCWYWESF